MAFANGRNPGMIGGMASQRERAARRMKWLVINLRWLFIFFATLVLFAIPPALSEAAYRASLLVISLIGLYQVGLTLLEFFEYWPRVLPWISVVMDIILTVSLFVATGDTHERLLWIGLLPAVPVALRHGWGASLAVIITVTVL